MEKLSGFLILFGILLVAIFVVDYFFIKRRHYKKNIGKKNKKNNKEFELMEITYLISKFKLEKNKLPLKWLFPIISLFNAIIISLVAVVVIAIDVNIIFQLLIGFVLLFALIYSMYELLGRFLVRKGFRK